MTTTNTDLLGLIDLDGTVVDFVSGWRSIWNDRYPERQILSDPTEFELENAYSSYGTDEEIIGIMQEPGFFLKLQPIDGAIAALEQMVKCGIDLFLCSSPTRATTSYTEKAEWVEMHLGDEWLKRLILAKDKTLVSGDFLIDDKPKITGMLEPSWNHIIYDASYNREVEPADTRHRITWATWPTILMPGR